MRRTEEFVDWTMNDKLENMIHDVGAESFVEVVFENISTNFTQLSIMLRLMNLKATNG